MNLTWTNVGVAAGWAALAAVAAWLVTWPVRRRSFAALMLSVTLTGTAASAGALLGAVHSMLLPMGDELALVLLTVVAGMLALVGATADEWLIEREHRAVGVDVAELRRVGVPAAPAAHVTRTVRDLQEQVRQTADALHAARDRERALEHSRRELVAWVSHDLRTPLAGLRAMTEALEDGVAGEPELLYKQIAASVDRLADLVDDLFDLSRVQAGAFDRNADAVNIGDLVSDCTAALEPLAAAKQVALSCRIDRSCVVRGNASELDRALSNLAANAIRHTPEGGRVEIVVDATPAQVEIAVADRCGGIPAEVLPRVFDVGYRASPARTPVADGSGAGLGLAIARGVVEAHGGAITVENTEVGCRFRLRLPRR
jgi:signal transduction histidine kinase